MGKPTSTFFCNFGHLLEDNPAGVMGEYDLLKDGEYPPCPVCESLEVVSTLDWGDPNCGPSIIPCMPIRQEDVEQTDHRGNRYFKLINVYDVSKKVKPNAKAVLKDLMDCLRRGPQHTKPHNNTVSFECVIPSDLLDRAKAIIGWDTPQADCDPDDK